MIISRVNNQSAPGAELNYWCPLDMCSTMICPQTPGPAEQPTDIRDQFALSLDSRKRRGGWKVTSTQHAPSVYSFEKHAWHWQHSWQKPVSCPSIRGVEGWGRWSGNHLLPGWSSAAFFRWAWSKGKHLMNAAHPPQYKRATVAESKTRESSHIKHRCGDTHTHTTRWAGWKLQFIHVF